MAIHYIGNDPDAGDGGKALRSIAPSPARAAEQSGFAVAGLAAEGEYERDTADFVGWQAREAALRAVSAFEEACGPLPGWRGEDRRRTLALIADAGEQLNAYYDREAISFFHKPLGDRTVWSGASTDVVAHETGHAILDAIRPQLFGVNMIEPGAFHEGFGDIVAVLTALADRDQRTALLAGGTDLRRPHFIEAVAEQISAAIGIVAGPQHNAAAPRRAFNRFAWAFPNSLPRNGPPGTLINEEHSLGQLASGIFYDLLCNLFEAGEPDEAGLWTAAKTAMRLCATAAIRAPIKPRFLEAWGRTMMVADREEQDGAHEAAIRDAFARHNIAVGASNFLSPRLSLGRPGARAAAMDPDAGPTRATRTLVRAALELPGGAPLPCRSVRFGDRVVAELTGRRDVDLTGVDPRLRDVTCAVPRGALVGTVDAAPALLGAIDTGFAYDAEVRDFAATLVSRDAIAFDGARRRRAGAGFAALDGATHRIVTERGGKVLKRVAFSCGCGRVRG